MEYKIGEFSLITRLSIKTLRFYHEKGILEPEKIDYESGYRIYTESQLVQAESIRTLRDMDFSIKEIQDILASKGEDEELEDVLLKKQSDLEKKISRYREITGKIKTIIRSKERVEKMSINQDIAIKQLAEIEVLSIRYKGQYNEIGKYLGRLYKEGGRWAQGAPMNLYHEIEFKEHDADIETCVPVKEKVQTKTMESRTLPARKVVSIIHKGPYETLGESYKQALDYITAEGYSMIPPSREIYIKGPGMIFRGNPKKYLTEIQIPVE